MDMCLCELACLDRATGYASQHIWCLSQARIKWEGCGRKGIRRKNGGMMEVGRLLVRMEWYPAGWSVCLPLLMSLRHKSPEEDFLLTQAHPVGSGKRAVKRLCVCVCVACLKFDV